MAANFPLAGGENSGIFLRFGDINVPLNIADVQTLQSHLPQSMQNVNIAQMMRGVIPQLRHQHSHGNERSIPGQLTSVSSNSASESVTLNLGDDFMETEETDTPPHHDAHPLPFGHLQNLPQNNDENQNLAGNHGHREHSHDTQQPMLHPAADWRLLLNSGIFVLILFLRLMSDHIMGLLVFIGLAGTFYYSNSKLVQHIHQLSLKEGSIQMSRLSLLWEVVFMTVNIGVVYYVFQDQQLWNVLIFQRPLSWHADIWTLFWVTVVTDFVLKFVTVILKALLSLLPQVSMPYKRRGKYYMFIEQAMQFYRSLVPIPLWIHFLSDDQQTIGKWFFVGFLLLLYAVFKFGSLFGRFTELRKAFQRLSIDTIYGVRPNSEDIKSKGENCAICQDDYHDPVMLSCKHIFCENCVSVWFDRERTCPMCRAQIHADSPTWKDGSTSPHLQWY